MRMRCEHIKQMEFEEMVIEEQFEREGILSKHITYGSLEIEKVKLLYQGNCLTCQGFPIVKAKD